MVLKTMSETLTKHFITDTFNPEKFVKVLGSQCIGAEDLRHERSKIQDLADSTSALLKRNVYQNYNQFIETAKEISHLETEMYQLSQLLSEQRSLLSISRINKNIIFEDKFDFKSKTAFKFYCKEEESELKLVQLPNNVEGVMGFIETPGQICLFDGSLLELDTVEGVPLKRIHAYLFNDVLMIASLLTDNNNRDVPKYQMQMTYDLENLAIVNIKDLGTVKFAFKLLSFPDTRIFQCASASNKKNWIEKCDQAKKLKLSQAIQLKIQFKEKLSTGTLFDGVIESKSINNHTVVNNEVDCKPNYPESLPEWILEVTEDLDSYIAQRHFEKLYSLLEKAKQFLNNTLATSELNEIKKKINKRNRSFISILTKELELSIEAKSLQEGGMRSAKRAIKFLIYLDHTTQACNLYLRLCSAFLKTQFKRVKRERTTASYVKQLSAIVFSNITKISEEFLKIFPNATNCKSALVVWCSHEIKFLISHLIKQMFVPQVSLSILVECILSIRGHCKQLTQTGMDFQYQLDNQLKIPLSRILQDTGEKYMDAIKVRASEDNWSLVNLETTQNCMKLFSELDNLGIPLPESYFSNKYWVSITNNTISFAKLYIGLLEDCLNVISPQIINVIENILISVLRIQIEHLQSSILNYKLKQEQTIVQNNAKYFHDVIIGRTLELYKSAVGHQFNKLLILQERFRIETVCISNKPKPAPRTSISKYASTEFV